MRIDEQMTLEEISPEYSAFVEKFKPKKTTDDCYTPANVYDTVLDWVVKEYGIDREKVVRPFWPGANYRTVDYEEGATVVDNPPFSIISEIVKTYVLSGVPFFLFAPYLTNLVIGAGCDGVCHIITDVSIMYENGAEVNTAFVTNLDNSLVRTANDLARALEAADKVNRQKGKKTLPKYEYPPHVVTATAVGYMAKHGVDYNLDASDAVFIRALDAQRDAGKSIFGGGFLLSEKAAAEKAAAEKAAAEKAAAEKAAAEKWKLSARERQIIAMLGRRAT